jgi:hypothetical protein
VVNSISLTQHHPANILGFFGGKKTSSFLSRHHRSVNILGFFGGKKNIKFSLPLPPTRHDTR